MTAGVISLTDRAVERVRALMATRPEAAGIRVWIKEAGCNGLAYQVDFTDEAVDGDDMMETPGGPIYIDPKAAMYILGSEMDYTEDKFFSGFLFKNPNEAGRCGCGESFTV